MENMKQFRIIPGFLVRQVADCWVAVPSGEAAQCFNGLLTLNDTGAEVFRILQGGATRETLLKLMAATYDVAPHELAADVDELLEQFCELAILQEVTQ